MAGIHLLRGTPIGWLRGEADDTPVFVWAETNGPGDDVRLELKDGKVVEIQVKKGLSRGHDLWTSLLDLGKAIATNTIHYGVLIVAPDSSGTVREDLPHDIRRLADGRDDGLSEIGQDLLARLKAASLSISDTCQRLGIRVVHGLDADGVEIKAAVEVLRHICALEGSAQAAWNVLYRDAIAIIERRGRWGLPQLLRVLSAEGIEIRNATSPAGVSARLASWVKATNSTFDIAGLKKRLPIDALLPLQTVSISSDSYGAESPSTALEHYRSFGREDSKESSATFDGEWTGRFYRRAVIVAGPGLGKSTLIKQLAATYASDDFLVFKVALKAVAASMRNGVTFEVSLIQWGLDGSGIKSEDIRGAALRDFVILADGLDDCGDQHHQVASGLANFALGYPMARIVVTTRPIGYETTELTSWRHYMLLPPETATVDANLASLMKAATDGSEVATNALEIAKRELARTPAKNDIAVSPQLLGMAASIIVQEGQLPDSRPKLFQHMVSLFEKSQRALEGSQNVDKAIAARVLDILGWSLMNDPLAGTEETQQECADELASDLGITPLLARMHVGTSLRYWQEVGLVEQLHHLRTTLFTFVHKAFAELGAARFLVALPKPKRRSELEKIADAPAWSEVVAFASGLGAGDELAAIFASRRAEGKVEQYQRALSLIGQQDAEISDHYAISLIEGAFAAIESGAADAFDLGESLADLAKTRKALVAPIADKHLASRNSALKLVAWVCATSAGHAASDPNAIVAVLRDLTPQISQAFASSLLGGVRVGLAKDRYLIQRLALTAIAALPPEQVEGFIESDLNHHAFDSGRFHIQLQALLSAKGLRPDWKPSWMRDSLSSISTISVNNEREWDDAGRKALSSIADSIVTSAQSLGVRKKTSRFLQFASLLRVTNFFDAPVSDVYAWTDGYDHDAVRETLRVLVKVSAVDSAALVDEALFLLQLLKENSSMRLFDVELPTLDVPEPTWSDVLLAKPDRSLIQRALNHGSIWVTSIAATLLQEIPMDALEIADLLRVSHSDGLAGAARVTTTQHSAQASEMLLDRLEGEWVAGIHHVFDALRAIESPITGRLVALATKGLTANSVVVAEAAAKLIGSIARRGVTLDVIPIELAFTHWQAHEKPSPKKFGVIPRSPRGEILGALFTLQEVSDERLLTLLSDPRDDVRGLVEKRLVRRLNEEPASRATFVAALICRKIAPETAARVLSSEVALDQSHVASLLVLLQDQDPKMRLVGMRLLTTRRMDERTIVAHARRLELDDVDEIRLWARRLLREFKALPEKRDA